LTGKFTTAHLVAYGNFRKGILNIAEASGEVEDRIGKPFQGRTGKLLQRTYQKLGIDLFEDCLNINSIRCHTPNNRMPSNNEMKCCRRLNMKVIDEYKPKLIIPLGNAAIYSLLGDRWKKNLGGITKWRGWTIPDQDLKAWVCPTFHPSYIERSDTGIEERIWEQDLKQAFSLLDMQPNKVYLAHPFPVYKEPVIHFTEDLSFLKNIGKPLSFTNEAVFDYETTGLKPQAAGHRIVCCSVAVSEDKCYVFMMPKSPKERQPFIDFLEDEKIPKVAHNIKFETEWSQVRLKAEVKNWIWDTMLMAHVLDNREGITSLAFQVYVNFGKIDYKDETAPFLEGDKKNGNAFNNILELIKTIEGVNKLMTRCALDSVYEYRLRKKQEIELLPF
jgi:uracil-DNA glycosylase family 4